VYEEECENEVIVLIDPPSGHRYGFPKMLPHGYQSDEDFSLRGWLVQEGYPEEEVEIALEHSWFTAYRRGELN